MLAVVFWNSRQESADAAGYADALVRFHQALNNNKPKGFRFSATFHVASVPWFEPQSEIHEDWYVMSSFAAMDALDEAIANGKNMDSHKYLMKRTANASGGIYYLTQGAANLASMRHASWMLEPRGVTADVAIDTARSTGGVAKASFWTRAMALGPAENCLLTDAPVSLPDNFRATHVERELVWSPSRSRLDAANA